MQRRWCLANSWIAIGAAAWLACGGALVPPTAHAAEPTQTAGARQAPASVANPFVAKVGSFRQQPENPLGLQTTSWIPATAESAEADKTALHRIPAASSFAPAPAQLFSSDELPRAPTIALPAPPLEKVVLAPTTSRDERVIGHQPAGSNEAKEDNSAPTPAAEVMDDELPIETPSFDDVETMPSSPWPSQRNWHSAEPHADDAVGSVSENRGQRSVPHLATVPLVMSSPRTVMHASPPTELTPQLLPAVQRGYALAQRGAMYAARAEFVQVLGRVVQAKDAAANSDAHAQALAAGLRAIDEAEDFVPDGVRVEAELDVRIVASSHRTPVLGGWTADVSPHEAVGLYHRYAQKQLAAAAAGEQVGSMALHGLGKVATTLAQRGNGDPALVRCALTMYSAALATCPTNHLAANELGVLLVRDGRADEAARLFERTIDLAPSATAYHNLAIAQTKLGFVGEAAANEQESQRLAAQERAVGAVSRRAGVEWVTPEQMSGVAQPGLTPTAGMPPQPKSRWQKTVDMAKSLPLVGGTKTR
jgi:hypothetical protein